MNKEAILGFARSTIRHALTTAGGGLLATGAISQGDIEVVSGAVAVLLGLAWSLYENRKKAA